MYIQPHNGRALWISGIFPLNEERERILIQKRWTRLDQLGYDKDENIDAAQVKPQSAQCH